MQHIDLVDLLTLTQLTHTGTCRAGERNERVEQLEGDIIEMKNIFHESLQAAMMAAAATAGAGAGTGVLQ